METALKVFSIISVVIGGLAILDGIVEEDGMASIIGGGMFLTQGILALCYIKKNNKINR